MKTNCKQNNAKQGGYKMKRLFYEVRLYDYSTKEEALKHKEAMTDRTKKGWWTIRTDLYNNGSDIRPYSIEYERQN